MEENDQSGQLRFADTHRLQLDTHHVPEKFHQIIPFAERWGIYSVEGLDDFEIRTILLEEASEVEVRELVDALAPFMEMDSDLDLYGWLAGPEALKTTPSQEYLAFTFLTMVYHRIKGDMDT